MNTSLFLGAYWKVRRESLESCADRLERFFQDLRACDPALAQWTEVPRTASEKPKPAVPVDDQEYLVATLEAGRHWTDVNRRVMEDLGFGASWQNKAPKDQSVHLHVSCGIYTPYVSNVVAISFKSLADRDALRGVTRAVANAWDPDWAWVVSRIAQDRQDFDAARPFVDWMVYVCDQWLPKPPDLKPPTSVERLRHGTLIVVQPDLPDPDNMEDVRQVERVRHALHAQLAPNA